MRIAVALHQRLALRKLDGEGLVSRSNLRDLFQPRLDALVLDLVTQAAAPEAPEGGDAAQQSKAADARGRNAPSGRESREHTTRARRCQQTPAQSGGQSAADFLHAWFHEFAHLDEVLRLRLHLASNAFRAA